MGKRTEQSIVVQAQVLNTMRLAYYRGDQWLDDDEYIVGNDLNDYPTNSTVIAEELTKADYQLAKQIIRYFRDWIRGDATIGLTNAEKQALANSGDPDIQAAWAKIQTAEQRNGFNKLPAVINFAGALKVLTGNNS